MVPAVVEGTLTITTVTDNFKKFLVIPDLLKIEMFIQFEVQKIKLFRR